MKYLNVGCGKKYHTGEIWENIDMVSFSKHVREHNLLKGFPYKDNSFNAVYHSQVLEHIPKENAPLFLKECFRVLNEGGILRVVVPDLENIIREYQRLLNKNIEDPTEKSKANYNWIMLELYDQVVRDKSGGQMKAYLEQSELVNEEYIETRLGLTGNKIRLNRGESNSQKLKRVFKEVKLFPFIRLATGLVKRKLFGFLLGKKYIIGDMRLGGEIHYWMYDRFSLSELLSSVGYTDIKVQNAHNSDISNWKEYALDVKDGVVFDQTSLFIEAKKPASTIT